jgi:DNA-binding GntR family transcriptional regulator
MKNEVVRAADLRDQVYEGLRRRIVEGKIRAGDKLTEVQVAEEFGVSRTPAREALVMLTQSGLIQGVGRSFQLPQFDSTDIRAIFEVRRLLEPYALRSIIANTPDSVLRTACPRMRTLIEGQKTFKGYVRAHTEYRETMFDLLDNKRLRKVIHDFNEQVQFIRLTTLVEKEARENSQSGNLRLIASIEARDADAAGEEIIALLDLSEGLALERIQQG